VSSGAYALTGVIVGGCITAGVQWLFERRRESRELLVVARVVAGDLDLADGALELVEKDGVLLPFHKVRIDSWEIHRGALGAALSSSDWDAVLASILRLRFFEQGLKQIEDAAGKPLVPVEIDRGAAAGARSSIAPGRDALRRLLERISPRGGRR
jgi:hypothetical protein